MSTTYILRVYVTSRKGEGFAVDEPERLDEALQAASGAVVSWHGCASFWQNEADAIRGIFSFEHLTLPEGEKPDRLLREFLRAAQRTLPRAKYIHVMILDSDHAAWTTAERRTRAA